MQGQEEWKKTKQACSDFETTKTSELSENAVAISKAQEAAATLKGEMAEVKQSLLETKNTLKELKKRKKTFF